MKGRKKSTGSADFIVSAARSPKVESRRDKIIELLDRDGQVRIAQLAELLDTTTVTIRSDLAAMEQEGLVERVPGGAIPTAMNLFNQEFQRSKAKNTDAKRVIATAVVREVEDGDTLFINGGTTTYFAAQMLKKVRKRLIVITNSVSIALELGTTPTYTVILTGGQINPYYSFTCGTEALDQLRHYQVNKAILSIDGIDESGVMTIHPEESTIAKMMIERSRCCIIIADSSKVGKEGLCTICDLGQVDMLITDSDVSPQVVESIRAAGVETKIIPKESV